MVFGFAGQARALVCPDQAAIEASIKRYIEEDYWSQGQRDIWKVSAIENFRFGPIKLGKIIRKDVDYSGVREVCPARLTFEFTVVKMDGTTEVTQMGDGKTLYFYQDDFGDWVFKIG